LTSPISGRVTSPSSRMVARVLRSGVATVENSIVSPGATRYSSARAEGGDSAPSNVTISASGKISRRSKACVRTAAHAPPWRSLCPLRAKDILWMFHTRPLGDWPASALRVFAEKQGAQSPSVHSIRWFTVAPFSWRGLARLSQCSGVNLSPAGAFHRLIERVGKSARERILLCAVGVVGLVATQQR
jgi:hypothetical protein